MSRLEFQELQVNRNVREEFALIVILDWSNMESEILVQRLRKSNQNRDAVFYGNHMTSVRLSENRLEKFIELICEHMDGYASVLRTLYFDPLTSTSVLRPFLKSGFLIGREARVEVKFWSK